MSKRVSGSRQAALQAGRSDDLSERGKAWVERYCAEQGVPVKLSDPLALTKIAGILCSSGDKQCSGGR
jgi:hypothetical protein